MEICPPDLFLRNEYLAEVRRRLEELLMPDEPKVTVYGMKVYESLIVPEGCIIISSHDPFEEGLRGVKLLGGIINIGKGGRNA